jgi:hypothetical protein
VDEKKLIERLQFLEQEKDKALAAANSWNGAIAECKHWLEELRKEKRGA